ncbi:heterokaryon incompatibility protein-domain-containing protein [Ilyonectria robusta]|uniref:heterokaryon incompatibility protein-domain-containing protein n=1 Tax=Ilyonectria robusta TaxID=1079257 RepID=UPI001E8E349E|nr:heterokaryon incompatibility protein-domain-containing protein [Ilyonectria robusta]KAH8685274.1 heterokaryon incompatibility protein-domain-containing protein [Ilyonectria robusta]
MSALEPTVLCTTCTGIFTGRWDTQLRGWKRDSRKPITPFNQEPAFGTAYEHGMEPYVHAQAATATLSYPHHTVAELRVSAANCPLCRIVELFFDAPDGLDNALTDYMDGRKPVGKDRWNDEEIESAKGYVFMYTERGKQSKLIFRYHVHEHWEATRHKDVNRTIGEREGNLKDVKLEMYDLADDKNKCLVDWTTKGTTLERISKWLEEDVDLEKHLPQHHPRQLPTRLLHLTKGASDPSVQLVNSKDTAMDVNTRYIALSHSWGKSMPITLIESRLAEFSTMGIAFGDLPRTFQDAAKLALDLGYEYIWIDSLCIIQDSPSDWLHEAQRMATVYTFSHLTIAASASTSTTTGLSPVNPRPRTVIVRPTWLGMINGFGVNPQQTLRIDDGLFTRFFHAITTAPLNSRGWTYQEYALSPRVLHCAEGEWWWDSISSPGIHRESSTEPQRWYTGPISISWPDSRSLYDVKPRTHPPIQGALIWDRFVSQYNQRALTKRRDKMVAFGAVTEIFGRVYNLPVGEQNEYVAGLWKSYLPLGLQWTVAERAERYTIQPGEEDEKYVIPSWSWASVNGLVRFSDRKVLKNERAKMIEGMPKVVDVVVTTEGGPFGPVLGGFIVLHGPLFRIRVNKETRTIQNGAWFRGFKFLTTDDSVVETSMGQSLCLDSWVGAVETWATDRNMYCAIVDEDLESGSDVFAVLMERVEGQERGLYKRIGSTIVDRSSSGILEKATEGDRKVLKEEEYMDMDEKTGHCTYKIV